MLEDCYFLVPQAFKAQLKAEPDFRYTNILNLRRNRTRTGPEQELDRNGTGTGLEPDRNRTGTGPELDRNRICCNSTVATVLDSTLYTVVYN